MDNYELSYQDMMAVNKKDLQDNLELIKATLDLKMSRKRQMLFGILNYAATKLSTITYNNNECVMIKPVFYEENRGIKELMDELKIKYEIYSSSKRH